MPQLVRHSANQGLEFIKEFLAPKFDDRDEERELNQISYVGAAK